MLPTEGLTPASSSRSEYRIDRYCEPRAGSPYCRLAETRRGTRAGMKCLPGSLTGGTTSISCGSEVRTNSMAKPFKLLKDRRSGSPQKTEKIVR